MQQKVKHLSQRYCDDQRKLKDLKKHLEELKSYSHYHTLLSDPKEWRARAASTDRTFVDEKQSYWKERLHYVLLTHKELLTKAKTLPSNLESWRECSEMQIKSKLNNISFFGGKSKAKRFYKQQLTCLQQIKDLQNITQKQNIADSMCARFERIAALNDFSKGSLFYPFVDDLHRLRIVTSNHPKPKQTQEMLTREQFTSFCQYIEQWGRVETKQRFREITWGRNSALKEGDDLAIEDKSSAHTIQLKLTTTTNHKVLYIPTYNQNRVVLKTNWFRNLFSGTRTRSSFYDETYAYEVAVYNTHAQTIKEGIEYLRSTNTRDNYLTLLDKIKSCQDWLLQQDRKVEEAYGQLASFGTKKAREFLKAHKITTENLKFIQIQNKLDLAKLLMGRLADTSVDESASNLAQLPNSALAEQIRKLLVKTNEDIECLPSNNEKVKSLLADLTGLQNDLVQKADIPLITQFLNDILYKQTLHPPHVLIHRAKKNFDRYLNFQISDTLKPNLDILIRLLQNASTYPSFQEVTEAIKHLYTFIYQKTDDAKKKIENASGKLLEHLIHYYIRPRLSHEQSHDFEFLSAYDKAFKTQYINKWRHLNSFTLKNAQAFIVEILSNPCLLNTNPSAMIPLDDAEMAATSSHFYECFNKILKAQNEKPKYVLYLYKYARNFIASYHGDNEVFASFIYTLQDAINQNKNKEASSEILFDLRPDYAAKRLIYLFKNNQMDTLLNDTFLINWIENPSIKAFISYTLSELLLSVSTLPKNYQVLIEKYLTRDDQTFLYEEMDARRLERFKELMDKQSSHEIQAFIQSIEQSCIEFPKTGVDFEKLNEYLNTIQKEEWSKPRSLLIEAHGSIENIYRYRLRWLSDTLKGNLANKEWTLEPQEEQSVEDYFCGCFYEENLKNAVVRLLDEGLDNTPPNFDDTQAFRLYAHYLKDIPESGHILSAIRVKFAKKIEAIELQKKQLRDIKNLIDKIKTAKDKDDCHKIAGSLNALIHNCNSQAEETDQRQLSLFLGHLKNLFHISIENYDYNPTHLENLNIVLSRLPPVEKHAEDPLAAANHTIFEQLKTLSTNTQEIFEALKDILCLLEESPQTRQQRNLFTKEALCYLHQGLSPTLRKKAIADLNKCFSKTPNQDSLKEVLWAIIGILSESQWLPNQEKIKLIEDYGKSLPKIAPNSKELYQATSQEALAQLRKTENTFLNLLAKSDEQEISPKDFASLMEFITTIRPHCFFPFNSDFSLRINTHYQKANDNLYPILNAIKHSIRNRSHFENSLKNTIIINNAVRFIRAFNNVPDVQKLNRWVNTCLAEYVRLMINASNSHGEPIQMLNSVIQGIGNAEQQQQLAEIDQLAKSSVGDTRYARLSNYLQKLNHDRLIVKVQRKAEKLDSALWELVEKRSQQNKKVFSKTDIQTLIKVRNTMLAKREKDIRNLSLEPFVEKLLDRQNLKKDKQQKLSLEEAAVSISARVHKLHTQLTQFFEPEKEAKKLHKTQQDIVALTNRTQDKELNKLLEGEQIPDFLKSMTL